MKLLRPVVVFGKHVGCIGPPFANYRVERSGAHERYAVHQPNEENAT